MKKITLTILLCVGLCTPALAQSVTKELIFSAPIPSPAGNVMFLWLDDSGVAVDDGCTRPGTIGRTGGDLIFCDTDNIWKFLKGVWQQNDDNVTLADPTPNSTQVGIASTNGFDPQYKLHVDGGIVGLTGDYVAGDQIGTPGAITGMLYAPRSNIFRVGRVTAAGTHWDDPNNGPDTVVFGVDNEASGAKTAILGGNDNTIAATQYNSVIVNGSNVTINDTNIGFLGHNFVGACDTCTLDGTGQVIVGGKDHDITTGGWNTIVGGVDNNTSGVSSWNFIGGGSNHDHSGGGANATVGGLNNDIFGQHSFIGAGANNEIVGGSMSAVLVGGHENDLGGTYSVLVGGDNNIAMGLWNFVGGGVQNYIQGAGSGEGNVIVGGTFNRARGNAGISPGLAAVVGGEYNQAIHNHSFVGGGGGDAAAKGNIASGQVSAIVGGEGNAASADYSFVGAGQGNASSGAHATIAGGQDNAASGAHSTIAGGQNNSTSVAHAAVGGGVNNIASGAHAAIPGGTSNVASGTSSLAFGSSNIAANSFAIAMGESVTASGLNSIALGKNVITTGSNSFVFGHQAAPSYTNATADTAIFFIKGNMGIGQGNGAEVPDFKLEVDGGAQFHGDIDVNGTVYTSDERFKTDIVPISNSLEKFENLNGVEFNWLEGTNPGKEGKDIGVIGQEVEKVFPEAVFTKPDGTLAVDYPRLVAPLIEAVKELNDKLNKEVSELKSENKQLKDRIRELEGL